MKLVDKLPALIGALLAIELALVGMLVLQLEQSDSLARNLATSRAVLAHTDEIIVAVMDVSDAFNGALEKQTKVELDKSEANFKQKVHAEVEALRPLLQSDIVRLALVSNLENQVNEQAGLLHEISLHIVSTKNAVGLEAISALGQTRAYIAQNLKVRDAIIDALVTVGIPERKLEAQSAAAEQSNRGNLRMGMFAVIGANLLLALALGYAFSRYMSGRASGHNS